MKNTSDQKRTQLSLLFLHPNHFCTCTLQLAFLSVVCSISVVSACGNRPGSVLIRLTRGWHSGNSCKMMVNNIISCNGKACINIAPRVYSHCGTRMCIIYKLGTREENAHLSFPHDKLQEQSKIYFQKYDFQHIHPTFSYNQFLMDQNDSK